MFCQKEPKAGVPGNQSCGLGVYNACVGHCIIEFLDQARFRHHAPGLPTIIMSSLVIVPF